MSEIQEPKVVCIADASVGAGAVELATFFLKHLPGWGCAKIELDDEAGPSAWIQRQSEMLLARGTDTAILASSGTSEVMKIGVHPDSVDMAIESAKKELAGSPGIITLGVIAPAADMNIVAAIPDVKPGPATRVYWEHVSAAAFMRGRMPEKAAEEFFNNFDLNPVPFMPLSGDLINIVKAKLGML